MVLYPSKFEMPKSEKVFTNTKFLNINYVIEKITRTIFRTNFFKFIVTLYFKLYYQYKTSFKLLFVT